MLRCIYCTHTLYYCLLLCLLFFFFFKQKTAYDMRISDLSSDVCSSDLRTRLAQHQPLLGKLADADAAAMGERVALRHEHDQPVAEIGRASSRERVCQYV